MSSLVMTAFFLFYPMAGFLFGITQCQSNANTKKLHTDLFADYKKEIMPTADLVGTPLKIGVTFYLASFSSINEVEETFSITAAIGLNWTDPNLVWDPSLYGYVYMAVIDPKDLWIPPFFLINKVDSIETVGGDTKFHTFILTDGSVIYVPGGILNAKCPIDITKFPFDTQTCTLIFLPWGFTSDFIEFSSIFDKARLEFFSPHSDWKLIEYSTSTTTQESYSQFLVKVTIKRQSTYYTVMIIIPTLLFSLLNPLVFVLPSESGERVSLSMTILLSYAIFLTLVSASIPKSSNPMCVLLVAMIAIISVSGLIVIGAILSGKYFFLNEQKLGKKLKYITGLWKQRRGEVYPIDEKSEIKTSGKDVSEMVDFIFFYGSYFIILIIIITYFFYVLL